MPFAEIRPTTGYCEYFEKGIKIILSKKLIIICFSQNYCLILSPNSVKKLRPTRIRDDNYEENYNGIGGCYRGVCYGFSRL